MVFLIFAKFIICNRKVHFLHRLLKISILDSLQWILAQDSLTDNCIHELRFMKKLNIMKVSYILNLDMFA